MRLVIQLARLNVEHGTGGPFGAAIFDSRSGALLAPGVNIVVPAAWSVGHAEIVAITLAQNIIGTHDLAITEVPEYELFCSTEPCAMCFGAIPWSGIRRVVCGARSEDAEVIGFDEGDKPATWKKSLETRGIRVVTDVLRDEARDVLNDYSARGSPIY